MNMNMQDVFSEESMSHLRTLEDKQRYRINMAQLAWCERYPDMTPEDFAARSDWFRNSFLLEADAEDLLDGFKEESERVLEILDQRYLASITKH